MVKATRGESVLDRIAGDAARQQLRARDDSVLAPGEPPDIGGNRVLKS
jgi:hypothetical protein